ncbi:MAG: hypothetical protein JST48_01050 [Bacteroidetes bacterium]|nr:hypothetical protein [Bacteroidota bacterium]
MKTILFSFFILGFAQLAQAQQDYSSDVKSPDALIAALYDVISGDAGVPRDWDRFKNLFKPEARLIPSGKNNKGQFFLRSMTPDEYVQRFTSRMTTGFFERELYRKTETFGTVTQLFSAYESKEKKEGPVIARGINSIQLFYDGNRYYIVTVFWCGETKDFPLTENYLKN